MSGRTLAYRKVRYKATLRTLSPVHIGGGAAEPACRYVIDEERKKAYVLRESFVAEQYASGRITANEYYRRPTPIQRFPRDEKERAQLALYELKAPSVAHSLDKEARPFVRNAFGKGYIPGTSVKGALRQALLFSHIFQDSALRMKWTERTRALIGEMKKSNPQTAGAIRRNKEHARPLEELFRNTSGTERPDPKNDILRAFSVADSEPSDNGFTLAAANIFSLSGGALKPMIQQQRNGQQTRSAPLFMEFLDPGVSFCFSIDIDTALLDSLSRREGVRFRNLIDIVGALKDHAEFTGSLESTFFDEFDNSGKLWKKEYSGEHLDENEAVIRLGWGCGWMGHSLFPMLAYGENDVAESPKSRKALVSGSGKALSLLGYATLRLEEE